MRVTSSFWVAAYLRRCQIAGAFAAMRRRGAESAGAIFVIVERGDRRLDLYGPAPQSNFAAEDGGRSFETLAAKSDRNTVEVRLRNEIRFDPDIWILEVEERDGRHGLDLVDGPERNEPVWPPRPPDAPE